MGRIVGKGKVIIKPLAYYNMLLHVLRFGNKMIPPDQCVEVMSILIGYVEGDGYVKDVIIEDAIPISHGSSVEVAFSINDYIYFEKIMRMFEQEGSNRFMVGWMHSHPNLFKYQIYFSSTDVKNQLSWQNDLNPSGIALVFDHAVLNIPENMGFKAIRLSDPSLGVSSKFHEVKNIIVEPPDSLDFYYKVVELINSIYLKEPLLLEINETPNIFGDIKIPDLAELSFKKPELNASKIVHSFQTGINQFLELSISPLIHYINNLSENITSLIETYNVQMRTDIIKIKESINTGIDKIQKKFKDDLNSNLFEAEGYVDDNLDHLDEDREEIYKIINLLNEEFKEKLKSSIEDRIKVVLDEFSADFNEMVDKIFEIKKSGFANSEKIENSQKSLNQLSEKISTLNDLTTNNLSEILTNISGNTTKKNNKIYGSIINLNKISKSIISDLKAGMLILEGTKTPILEKIKKLEME
ncbi:hypothetical protein LCGC14_0628240, partial [marine sediment metagenome]